MNVVRYYLAICILVNHFSLLTGTDVFQPPRIFGGAGSFFALSGFLMFTSFEKYADCKKYFVRRAKRILPPYFLIVLLAAMLGVVVSTESVADYFSASGFWKYLLANLSFLNFLHTDLPGVFTSATNDFSPVNGSLWTMKGEVLCYLLVPVVYALLHRNRHWVKQLLAVLIIAFGFVYISCRVYSDMTGANLEVIRKQFMVMMLFFVGAAINYVLPVFYRYRYVVLVCCGGLLMADYFKLFSGYDALEWTFEVVISPFVTALMVIACSITGTWGTFLAKNDSVSYDVYLVHWPIIQSLVSFGLIDALGPYPTLMIAIVLSFVYACLSNRFLGRIFLKTKKNVVICRC